MTREQLLDERNRLVEQLEHAVTERESLVVRCGDLRDRIHRLTVQLTKFKETKR